MDNEECVLKKTLEVIFLIIIPKTYERWVFVQSSCLFVHRAKRAYRAAHSQCLRPHTICARLLTFRTDRMQMGSDNIA